MLQKEDRIAYKSFVKEKLFNLSYIYVYILFHIVKKANVYTDHRVDNMSKRSTKYPRMTQKKHLTNVSKKF